MSWANIYQTMSLPCSLGSEIIEAKGKGAADRECKDVASQYGAVSSEVEPTDQQNTWNCKFKFWG